MSWAKARVVAAAVLAAISFVYLAAAYRLTKVRELQLDESTFSYRRQLTNLFRLKRARVQRQEDSRTTEEIAPAPPRASWGGNAVSSVNAKFAADPKLRAQAVAYLRSAYLRRYAQFFHEQNVPDEQVDRILGLLESTAAEGAGYDALASGEQPILPRSFYNQLTALVGSSTIAQQFAEYDRSSEVSQDTADLAGDLYSSDDPLSAQQGVELNRILADSSSEYRSGGVASNQSVNWNLVLLQAQEILSPTQLDMLKARVTLWSGPKWRVPYNVRVGPPPVMHYLATIEQK